MIRLVTSRRLTELTRERDAALEQVEAAHHRKLALTAELAGVYETVHAHHDENRELLDEVRQLDQELATVRAEPVFILFYLGELHSVHATPEAAERAAEQHGASRHGWSDTVAGLPASSVLWRITQAPVRRAVNSVHEIPAGVHDAPAGVQGGGVGGG